MIHIPEGVSYGFYELMITGDCNLRCKYCFEDWEVARSCSSNPGSESKMDEKFIDDFIPFMLQTRDKSRRTQIEFFGGEPLMNWKFIQALTERIKGLNLPIDLSTTTNCTLLTSKSIDYLVDNFSHVTISIDGTARANVNRVDMKGNPIWDSAISKITELIAKSRNKMSVGASLVVNDRNYKYIEESYDLIVNRFGIDADILFDYSTEATDEYLNSIKEQLHRMFVKNRWILPITISEKALNRDYIEHSDHFCFHPKMSVVINAKGQLSFCHILIPKEGEEYLSQRFFGDIYKGIYNFDHYNEIVRRTRFSEWSMGKECESCSAASWCKGGCIAGHFAHSESKNYEELNPNFCKIHKIIDEVSKQI